jgi:hypothetical protein
MQVKRARAARRAVFRPCNAASLDAKEPFLHGRWRQAEDRAAGLWESKE